MHRVDPKLIVACGSPDPKDPREITLCHYRQAEELYLTGERLPSPDMEFIRGWLDRNAPPCDEGATVIAMDAGQFLFEGDELTTMLDFEFVVVGDRHVDFAALRSRDTFEQIGDLESFYQLYEARGGRPVDRDKVLFQRAAFVMYAPLEVAEELARPAQAEDYLEYLRWHVHGTRTAMEDIAQILRLELESYSLPEPVKSRYAAEMEAVAAGIARSGAADDFAVYHRGKLARTARHLALRETYGAALEREYLADVKALTGRVAASEWDADVLMEGFVRASGPEMDGPLLRLLHRRATRMWLVLQMAA
jgi:hypothetical protein